MEDRRSRVSSLAPDEFAEARMKWINQAISKAKVPQMTSEIPQNLPPVVFIAFVPRSGSTYLSQLLARSRHFSYISNFIARFWEAPDVGMFLQQQAGLDSLIPAQNDVAESLWGVTSHPMDPHEFGFFWRRFLPDTSSHFIPEPFDEYKVTELRECVTRMRAMSAKPLFFKNAVASYNYKFIKAAIPEAKFIVVNRNSDALVNSIIKGRRDVQGDEKQWFSLKPKEYESIVSQFDAPVDQVRAQVSAIEAALTRLVADFSDDCLEVNFDQIVAQPEDIVQTALSFANGR